MQFTETPIPGVYIIDLNRHEDNRGYFARAFCTNEFEQAGLLSTFVQCNISFNKTRGTLRGMHYQVAPAPEAKFVRCMAGAIYDVVVDLRPGSATYLQHVGVELTADNQRALYVPEMFGHGFQTLADNTQIFYQVSAFYTPECERGLRHDDPAIGIDWPLPVTEISQKDATWPLLAGRVSEVVR